MNDPQTTVLYTLSTLAQTCAALAAFVGAVGIFRLQSLRDRRREAESEMRAEYKMMWGFPTPDAMVLPLSAVLNSIEFAIEQPDHPALSAEGLSRAKAARDRWRGVKSAFDPSRRALIFFEAWNLSVIGVALVGFNHVPALATSSWALLILWPVAVMTVGLTGYCVFVWTKE